MTDSKPTPVGGIEYGPEEDSTDHDGFEPKGVTKLFMAPVYLVVLGLFVGCLLVLTSFLYTVAWMGADARAYTEPESRSLQRNPPPGQAKPVVDPALSL